VGSKKSPPTQSRQPTISASFNCHELSQNVKALHKRQLKMSQEQIETARTEWAYLSVKQFTKKHQAFTTGGLRALIFNEHSNGLAKSGAIVRLNRKVLIDENLFFSWVIAQNKGA
jgi:hypothetical protein